MSGTRDIADSTKVIVSAGDMSATINSIGTDLQGTSAYTIQAVYSGSPTGTLKIQISLDRVSEASSVTTWSDYTGSSLSISTAGDVIYKVERQGERWVRLVYTFTSGTGTLNANIGIQG